LGEGEVAAEAVLVLLIADAEGDGPWAVVFGYVQLVQRLGTGGRAPRGVWRYDPAEVVRTAAGRSTAAKRTRGQTAALAFRMFDQGGELKDIVMALQEPPEEIRRLFREWQSALEDPPPASEPAGARLLDEEPGADEAFARAIAQASGLSFASRAKPRP
jgi:hypothetical protein